MLLVISLLLFTLFIIYLMKNKNYINIEELKELLNSGTKPFVNNKNIIKDIISKELEKYKNLIEVKNFIEQKFQKSLTSIDDSYIEIKYIEYCSEFCLKELKDLLQKLNEKKCDDVVQEIIKTLDTINNFKQVPDFFKKLQYYQLLIKHYELLSKENEKILINKYKTICLEQIISYNSSVEKELYFIDIFIDFLSSSKNIKSICNELKLEDFCSNKISFEQLLRRIINLKINESHINLIEAATCLQYEKDLVLRKKFQEVLRDYLKAVEIQETLVDNRWILEVKGKNVVLSEILQRIENMSTKILEKQISSTSEPIEEVRFICCNTFHIDKDFKNEIWHGKNIVILTKTIKIHDKITWNLSGENNNHIYLNNAGTREDGHGKQGRDGYPGESGGNVLILAKNIENYENFTIISNGGNGSRGQDGGDGKNGKNGTGITKDDFNKKFPATAKYKNTNVKTTLDSIKNDLQTIKCEWYRAVYSGYYYSHTETYDKDVIDIIKKDCESWRGLIGSIYINAITKQGNEITFSFDYLVSCEAFLLYKGTPGQAGGHGGPCGLGAQGGYPGEIIIKNLENDQKFNVKKTHSQGREGQTGKSGLYGTSGKNGWDMGYMDSSAISFWYGQEWPKFYGFYENRKIEIKYYSEYLSNRIRCPYKKHLGNGSIFAEMKDCIIEHKKEKKYEERKNIRENNDREQHAEAVRKKGISQKSIINNYAQYLSSLEKNTIQELRADLENKKQSALQVMSENEKQQQTIDLYITCHVNRNHFKNLSSNVREKEAMDLEDYAIKESYWTQKLLKFGFEWENDLTTASYYLLSAENTFGSTLTEELITNLEVNKKELSSKILTRILSNFHNQKWNLSRKELKILYINDITSWEKEMNKKFTANDKERNITELIELIKYNENITDEIFKNLPKIKIAIESNITVDFTEFAIKRWVKTFQNIRQQNIETLKKILTVIDRAIELKRDFKLRDTQKLTVLALLTNTRSTLAQVSTGEGKSLIVVSATIIKALRGEKVDIITSSSVLARRDAEENKDIYSLFGINVSHNCSEDIEKRKEAYSNNQVVYGDLSNFQRDYLLDKFYGKNILGDRRLENIIVDEVDSMLLDKGNNMLYLSHNIAGLDTLESVYLFIWQWLNRLAYENEDFSYIFDSEAIKEAVIYDLYGLIKKEDIAMLGAELSEQKNIIWERLIRAKILDTDGKLLIKKINYNLLHNIFPESILYQNRLYYLLKETIDRQKFILAPNYIKPFIEKHLDSWINSAITAYFMIPGQDYVVDVDRTGSSSDRNPNITIVDRDTGTDQANSQWDEALHQFLQLKHGCKLSLQSLKAVFISNVSYFKLYNNLYGVTGTLGSQIERNLLKEIHQVDFVTIPTAKSNQFWEDAPILCTSKNKWINKICNETKNLTETKNRSVLIICETVNDVETLHEALSDKNIKNIHNYKRDYEDFDIVQGTNKLGPGQVIIATNLAGRGTDIKIDEVLKKSGGLHVCLTYLPANVRIEQQAFGRAARIGDKGSGRLIIVDTKGQGYSNTKIIDLKKERDAEELRRISDIKVYYDTQITTEENCFKTFKYQYEQLKLKLDEDQVPDEVKEILLQSCLDNWAFWLDENSKLIKNLTEKTRKSFNDNLNKFISKLNKLRTGYYNIPGLETITNKLGLIYHDKETWLPWLMGQPIQMIKLGKYLAKNGKYCLANKIFDEVINQESYFSEAAHYYNAYVIGKQIDWEEKDQTLYKKFKKELHEASKLFYEHSSFCINAAGYIEKIKRVNTASIIQIDSYKEQQQNFAGLYQIFSGSIDDIFGQVVTPQHFVNYDIKKELADDIYNDFLEGGVLKKSKIKNICEEKLQVISAGYGVSVKLLKNFLSMYENEEIYEINFLKKFKKEVKIPNRNEFWKLLVEQQVLQSEIKYVVIDNEKLKETYPTILKYLENRIDREELKKEILESKDEQIFLNPEQIEQQKHKYVLEKNNFIKTIGSNKYQIMKKKGLFEINKTANINKNKIKSAIFSIYDSITLEDFLNKTNITKSEAEKILSELVNQQVLKKNGLKYSLKIKFYEIGDIKLQFCPIYENIVKRVLSAYFSYRIALQKIEQQLKEKNSLHIKLMSNPHQTLFLDLLDEKIVKPVRVARIDEKAVKDILKKLDITDEVKITNIIKTLERSRSSLKTLEIPEFNLNALTDLCQDNFGNREELYLFSLKGLDHLIQSQEKKWTKKMLRNTAIVATIGVVEITIGTAIEIYSAGYLTHVGSGFISEGINDIVYAAGALRSGYFNWENYGEHKIYSSITTAVTFTVGAYFSKGVKVSYFGHKLFGLNLEIGGKKTAEICGKELIKITSVKIVAKEAIKRIILKITDRIKFSLSAAVVDIVIESLIQKLCDTIVAKMLSDIKKEVEKHLVYRRLEEAYETLGELNARKLIYDLTESVFNELNFSDNFLSKVSEIANCVIQGIAEAVEKRSLTDNPLNLPIDKISKIASCLTICVHIANALQVTNIFLNNIDQKLENKLKEIHRNFERSSFQKYHEEKNCKIFVNEIIEKWKCLLYERVREIIVERVVRPILNYGAERLVQYAEDNIKEVYESYKENGLFQYLQEMQQGFIHELQED